MKTTTGKKITELLDHWPPGQTNQVLAALKMAVQCLDALTDQGNVAAPDALNKILDRLVK